MTCPTLAMRRTSLLLGDVPDPALVAGRAMDSIRRRVNGEGTIAQLTRFGGVGLISSALYALTFLTFGSLGSLAANVLGMATSTLVANELHRRLTFRASAAVGWLRAQLQGGGPGRGRAARHQHGAAHAGGHRTERRPARPGPLDRNRHRCDRPGPVRRVAGVGLLHHAPGSSLGAALSSLSSGIPVAPLTLLLLMRFPHHR